MKNKLISKLFSVVALMLLVTSSIAAEKSEFIQEQIRVNNYYKNLVLSQVEAIVPKGNYTVDVNMQLNREELKKFFDSKEVSFDLPLSGTFMNGGESSLIQEGPQSASVDELLKFVDKKTIRIGVTESVSPVIRAMIKDTVQRELQFSSERGEVVETFDLPKEFSDSWVQWLQQGQQGANSLKSTWIFLVGILAFCGMMGVFFMVGIRSLSNKVLGEINALAQRQAEDKPADFNFSKEMNTTQAQQKTAGNQVDTVNENRVFEKLDLQTLKLLCADCISQPKYQYVPYGLIFNWLDRSLSDSLDQALVDHQKPFPTPNDQLLSKSEVAQFISEHFPQYRMLSRSDFAENLTQYSVDQTAYFLDTLNIEDAVVVLEKLTPLKKKACIAIIPLKKRLELAKVSTQNLSTEQLKSKEKVLMKGIEMFVQSPQAKTFSIKQASKKLLQPEFLDVTSFSDDETLYEMTKEQPGVYHGILGILDGASSDFWSKIDVKELAMLTFGYGDQRKSFVNEKLSEKRREWYKSFCEKFAQSGLTFDHPIITSARSQLLERSVESVNDRKAA